MSKNKDKKPRPFLLIELLHTFSKRELSYFSSFVACTYFNTDQYVVALLKILIEKVIHKKDFDKEMQRVVYRYIFPKRALPAKELNQQEKSHIVTKMNQLMRLAEQFLCNEALKKNAVCQTELLYGELLERNQFSQFNRQVTKDKKVLEAKPAKGIDEYAQQFKMELGRLNYLHRRGYILKEDNLPKVVENLDTYYLLNKLQLHTTSLALSLVMADKTYDYTPMEAVESLMKLPQYAVHPLIRLHRMAIDLIQTNDVDIYHQFLDLLEEYNHSIINEDLNNFYKVAVNFCGEKIIEGDETFYRSAFDLYRKMDTKNLLKEGNFMPAAKLKNIVTLYCRLNEFEWAEEMIEKYRPALEKEYADSVYHFNMGLVAFYQRDFKVAISHFIRVDKVSIAYDINSRIMLLKSHYELDAEYDERTIRTFLMTERFVGNNKLLTTKDRRAYRNFIRLLINLYKVRHNASKITPNRLIEKLNNYNFISDKKWLLGKIAELEDKH